RQWFSDLSWFRATWETVVDGQVVAHGRLPLPRLAPQTAATVDVPRFDRPSLTAGQEAFLTVRFATARDLPWAPQGFEVGWRQLALGAKAASRASRRVTAATVDRTDDHFRFVDGSLDAVVHRSSGRLTALRHDGGE